MNDYLLYEKAYIRDPCFPVRAFQLLIPEVGVAFHNHWHEQMEVLYFLEGRIKIECNSKTMELGPGDLLFINSNELHYGHCIEKPLKYYCVLFDFTLLTGSFDGNCEQKYITPMAKNLVVFTNKITGDREIIDCLMKITAESDRQENGYELFVKASFYQLLGLLFRRHVEKILTERESRIQMKNLERLNHVLQYIEENYMEVISLDQLAQRICLSRYHFSHLFRDLTGKSINEYINSLRIDKAEMLLRNTDMNITEIAMATGFCDANYFSRVFKKYKKYPPSSVRVVMPPDR